MPMALLLVEFAATAHPAASRWRRCSPPLPPYPSWIEQYTYVVGTRSTATALFAIVTLGRKIDPKPFRSMQEYSNPVSHDAVA